MLRLAYAMCLSMPPVHEGDTHRTLTTSYAYELRSRYAMSPMLGGGSSHHDGSNGIECRLMKDDC
ncbi:MAG: hypothetical protein IKX31_03590 [Muribaculaceae bacterium]|nr:hypothetical protein [Muribaculaceae bacterium]